MYPVSSLHPTKAFCAYSFLLHILCQKIFSVPAEYVFIFPPFGSIISVSYTHLYQYLLIKICRCSDDREERNRLRISVRAISSTMFSVLSNDGMHSCISSKTNGICPPLRFFALSSSSVSYTHLDVYKRQLEWRSIPQK